MEQMCRRYDTRNAFLKCAARVTFMVPFAALLCSPFPGWAGSISLLGSAQSFAVLGYAGVTNTGATQIYGNVGVSPLPLTSITGFESATVTGGTILGPGSSADAKAAIDAAAVTLAGYAQTGTYAVNLGGLGVAITPGVYDLSGAATDLIGTVV